MVEPSLFDPHDLPAAPPGPLVRVRLTVAYDGTGFSGMAPNPGVRTVGGLLVEALSRVLRHPVRLSMAGRTDRGVHAWGQVVSFDAAADGLDLAVLARSLNRLCGPAVAVREAVAAPEGFDARHSAIARRYRYTVLNRPEPDPFRARTAWHVAPPLDVAAMRLGADPLVGEHDFSAFCRVPKAPAGVTPSMVRRVLDAGWVDLGDGVLRFDVAASSFCQQMVRSVVGLLVEVGRGRRRAGDVLEVLRAGDRARAAQPAPAAGLCLWSVDY